MKKQKGFTLIEIMIAMVLGLIVIGGALSIYISTIRGSSNTVKSTRLNHDLDSALQLMTNDIRRAGFWGGAVVNADVRINPFMLGNANIQVPIASCILYTYDSDGDGLLDDSSLDGNTTGTDEDTSEFFGFRLVDGTVDMRSSKVADTTGDCTGSGWEAFTSPNVDATTLTFSTTPYKCLNVTTNFSDNKSCASVVTDTNLSAGDEAVEIRQIDIRLIGQVLNDNGVTKDISSKVKVRNNRVFTQ